MAVQYRIDNIVDNSDGTVTFQIGPYGITKDKTELFDRNNFNFNHMLKNMRLSYHIGTKSDIASREFLDAVNGGSKGMDLADGTWFIRSVSLVPGTTDEYDVAFSQTKNGTVSHTIRISRQDIQQETSNNPEDIFDNIKSALRRDNFNDLTPAAIATLKARPFWA